MSQGRVGQSVNVYLLFTILLGIAENTLFERCWDALAAVLRTRCMGTAKHRKTTDKHANARKRKTQQDHGGPSQDPRPQAPG